MGDFDITSLRPSEPEQYGPSSLQDAFNRPDISPGPFHAQFEYLNSQPHGLPTHNTTQIGRTPFDMTGMAHSLPGQQYARPYPRSQYDGEAHAMFSPGSVYQMHQASQFQGHRGQHQDINHPRLQQAQIQPMGMPQQSPYPAHLHAQYPRLDMYGYAAPHFSPMGPRFGSQGFPMGATITDMGRFARPAPDPVPVPSYPRGPPRKPKQSGHALWVGNLPPDATVIDLKDHFSRDATRDIESLFLIAKSNCAFVNYRTEGACVAAMNRFHDSRFNGVRLVCRLRRGSTASTNPVQTPESRSQLESPVELPNGVGDAAKSPSAQENSEPVIVGLDRTENSVEAADQTPATTDGRVKVQEKYFVVKSLTVQDLEASVRNGTWATQSHNEDLLNRAFDEAENVYLIFSANKSGEYFGYARMVSAISGEPVNLGGVPANEESQSNGSPQSIPTAATDTAPKGRIIDDSARGTIFWEAESSEDESDSKDERPESGDGQGWGRQFKIEWVSTSKLPFFRTRGLRNPWNANREVKIARDGTELEPSVGRRLVQMFQRPSPAVQGGGAMMAQGGMPFQ